MKQLFKFLIICFLIIGMYSCNSELNEKTVKILIESSLQERKPVCVSFFTGNRILLSNVEVPKYMKLQKQGFIELDNLGESWGEEDFYNIRLTDKSEEYVYSIKDLNNAVLNEIDRLMERDTKKQQAVVRIASLTVSRIDDIHEIPSENKASAKVTFDKSNKTPFWVLAKDTVTTITREIFFIKTTDNNWKVE